MRPQRIRKALVRGDQSAFRNNCDRYIQTVIYAPIEGQADAQSILQEFLACDGEKVASLRKEKGFLGVGSCPPALPDGFPEDVAEFCPEEIRNRKSNLARRIAP